MDAVDVWSCSGGGDPLAAFSAPRALRRTFDAGVKGYVAELPAGGPPRPSLQVSLVHPALVLQVFVPGSGALSFELSCTDSGGNRRRLTFSTGYAEPKATPLVAQVPLPLRRGCWLNVVLHVAELVAALYSGSQLRSIEAITLGCVPQLRRIFTLRDAPSGAEASVPRALDLPSGATAEVVVIDSRAAARCSAGAAAERVSQGASPAARAGLPRRAVSMAEASPALAFGRRLRSHSSTGAGVLPSPPARPGSSDASTWRPPAGAAAVQRLRTEAGASPRSSQLGPSPHASPPAPPAQQAAAPPPLALPPAAGRGSRPRPPRLQVAHSPTRQKTSPPWGDDSAGPRASEGATPLSPGSAQSRYGSAGEPRSGASRASSGSGFSAVSPAVAAAATDDVADVMSLRALTQRASAGGGAPSPQGPGTARSRGSSSSSPQGSPPGAASSSPPSPPGGEARPPQHAWLSSPRAGPGPLSPLRWQAAAAKALAAAMAQSSIAEAPPVTPPTPPAPPPQQPAPQPPAQQTAAPFVYSPTGWVPPAALWPPAAAAAPAAALASGPGGAPAQPPQQAAPPAAVFPPGAKGLTSRNSWLSRSDEGGPSAPPAWAVAEAAAAKEQAALLAAAAAAARARPASAYVVGTAPAMRKVPSLSQISNNWRGGRRAEDSDAIELGSASDSEGGDEPCGLPSPQPGAPSRRVASDAEASEPSPDARPRARSFAGGAEGRSSGASSGADGERSIVFDAASGLYVDPATGAVFEEVLSA